MKINFKVLAILSILIIVSCSSKQTDKKTKFSLEEVAFINKVDSLAKIVKDSIGIFSGMSITVVKDNKVLLTKGYGYVDSKTKEPVTDETMFYIASTTKSFVGLLAAILDERGIFPLNTTLQEAFPDIMFNDSIPANKVTMRHLLSHTSTVNNGPLTYRLAYTGQINDSIQLNLVRFSVPNGKEIGEYLYDNTGYNLYTIALKKNTGIMWKDALKNYVFNPLNMKSTTAYISDVEREKLKYAIPSATMVTEKADSVIPMNFKKTDATMHSAGGLITNAKDLSKWLLAQLSGGKINGQQQIDSMAIALNHKSIAEIKDEKHYYTLGWNKYRPTDSTEILYHFGSYRGYYAAIYLFPKQNLAVAAMSSGLYSDYAQSCLQNFAIDYFRNPEKADDNFNDNKELGIESKKIIHGNFMNDLKNREKRKWTINFGNDYSGNYYNEKYGNIQIEQSNNIIKLIYGDLKTIAEPYPTKNSIRVEFIPYKGEIIEFNISSSGIVKGLNFRDRYYTLNK